MTEKQRILKNYRKILFDKFISVGWIKAEFDRQSKQEQKEFKKYLTELEKDIYYKGYSIGRNISETLNGTE